jgi:hypothetical protein
MFRDRVQRFLLFIKAHGFTLEVEAFFAGNLCDCASG